MRHCSTFARGYDIYERVWNSHGFELQRGLYGGLNMWKLIILALFISSHLASQTQVIKHHASVVFNVAFDFRATSGFVTDPSYATYVLSSTAYPTTRTVNGMSATFGIETGTCSSRDRDNTIDPRLAGMCFTAGSSTYTFRVDLPATGLYTINAAFGDANNGQVVCAALQDGSTTFASTTNLSVINFADAAFNLWSTPNWPSNNVAVTHTFTSTIFRVTMGSVSATGVSPLAFVEIHN